jgi:hypothetical protein
MKLMAPGFYSKCKQIIWTILIITILMPLAFTGCTTGKGKSSRRYLHSNVKTISSIDTARAAEKIDQYATSMIFFKLDKDIDALAIGITAEYTADIMGTKKTKKTYFIVEKTVDMSQYKYKNFKYHYAELGRNFDSDWNREKEISIVSRKTEPFRNLDGNSLYRIRFTTFSTENLDFTIKIDADCGITYMEDFK